MRRPGALGVRLFGYSLGMTIQICFHNYANGKRANNTIWKMPTEDGQFTHSFHQLAHLGNSHFQQLLKAPRGATLSEIVRIIGLFPCFIDQDESDDLIKPVSMGELEITLQWFKKDKSPGLDGWSVEFYMAFYDTIRQDLLLVVEDCRLTGRMYETINSTFIALIPKVDSPLTFNDFSPISLYNYLYKIIAKNISNFLKPILFTHISLEQFAFLHNRQYMRL